MTVDDREAVDRLAAETYGEGFEEAEAFAAKVTVGVALVAVDEDRVVAYGVALPWRGALPTLQSRPTGRVTDPEYLYVHDICVAVTHRRAGLGPTIMSTLERSAADLGLATMCCVAVHGAEVVWHRLGWRLSDHTVPADFPAGSVAMTKVVAPG